MNFDELQHIWNAPGNNLSSDRMRSLAEQFTRHMLRRRRFQAVWLASTFLALAVTTGIAVRAVALGKASLELEWALVPLLVVPWLFAFHFLRRHLNPASPMSRGEVSVTDALRAALASNRAEQSHLKKVGLLFAIMIPLLGLSVHQLHSAQKVSERELVSMVTFLGGVLTLSGAGVAARYFGRVLPRERQLNTLVAELADEPQQ